MYRNPLFSLLQGDFTVKISPHGNASRLVESYLYACPKVGHARNRSRTACFNGRFLKQAILGSKQLAGEQVSNQ